jgi:hypothetical protein
MGIRRVWLIAATATVLALAAVAVAVSLATGADRQKEAAPTRSPSKGCAAGLLKDWSDGRIDGIYPIACYRSALKSLPTDLEVYSTAPDDIAQALSQRIVQNAQKVSGHHGAKSVRKLASARPTAPSRNSSTRPARHSSAKVKPPK